MSNIRQFPNNEAIEDDAALWVAKIYGQTYKTGNDIPEATLAELEEWMSQSPLHRETFFKTVGSWDAIGMLSELSEMMPLSELQSRSSFGLRVWRWLASFVQPAWGRPGLALCGAATLSLAIYFWLSSQVGFEPVEYITDIGIQNSYVLTDGSVLNLNTNSNVRVDFSSDRRAVFLKHGEASFDVTKDSRPFVVYAGDGMVLALGTKFNVDYRSDLVEVIVSEGTVKVVTGRSLEDEAPSQFINDFAEYFVPATDANEQSDAFQQVLLDAGETAQYSDTELLKESIELYISVQKLAWQEGALIFSGESLEEALAEIARYTDKELLIDDPSIRSLGVGGRYRLGDFDALINSLALGLDLRARYTEENKILFSAN